MYAFFTYFVTDMGHLVMVQLLFPPLWMGMDICQEWWRGSSRKSDCLFSTFLSLTQFYNIEVGVNFLQAVKTSSLEPELCERAFCVPDCSSAFMQHKYGLLWKRIVLPSPLSQPCDSPSFMQPPDLLNRSLELLENNHVLCRSPQEEIAAVRLTNWSFSYALRGQGVCEGISVKNALTHKMLAIWGTGIN